MAKTQHRLEEPLAFGKYLLVEKVASGGMAEIFKARASGPKGEQYTLAIKRILPQYSSDEEFISLLIDEAKLMVHLNHPNIVPIIEFGKLGESYYIAMDFVDGATLKELYKRVMEAAHVFPLDLAIHIVREIGAGLSYAHRKLDEAGKPLEIVHRDISPANILLSFGGEVKIADFGISKASNQSHRTQVGIIRGKTGYMSPEQTRANSTVDHRSDIYSLGIILFELLSGQRLYKARSVPEALKMIREGKIPPLRTIRPEVSQELESIVMKALASKPEERYQRAEDFVDALNEFLIRSPLGRPVRVTHTDLVGYLRRYFKDEMLARIAESTPIHLHDPDLSASFHSMITTISGKVDKTTASSKTFATNPHYELSQPEAKAPSTDEAFEPSPPKVDQPTAPGQAMFKLTPVKGIIGLCLIAGAVYWITRVPSSPSNVPPPVTETTTPAPTKTPRVTPKPPSRVSLSVNSIPEGAVVYVNGKRINGRTPLTLPPQTLGKSILVELEMEGYEKFEKELKIDHVRPEPQTFFLIKRSNQNEKPPPVVGPPVRLGTGSGELSINTTPWTFVYVDGKKVGHTPLANMKLREGRHRVRVENKDFGLNPHEWTVDVKANDSLKCFFDYEKSKRPNCSKE